MSLNRDQDFSSSSAAKSSGKMNSKSSCKWMPSYACINGHGQRGAGMLMDWGWMQLLEQQLVETFSILTDRYKTKLWDGDQYGLSITIRNISM
jgi:hypothetical protein